MKKISKTIKSGQSIASGGVERLKKGVADPHAVSNLGTALTGLEFILREIKKDARHYSKSETADLSFKIIQKSADIARVLNSSMADEHISNLEWANLQDAAQDVTDCLKGILGYADEHRGSK